jgi:P2 family phage contractile tail tube protein
MNFGTNIIPERIVGYRAYKNGKDLLGVVDVELPKIQYITDAIKGAGILGELETPTTGQTKALKVKITFRTNDADMIGLLDCAGQDLEFRSAIQKYDAAGGNRTYDPHRVVVRGFPSEGDFGKLESGAAGGSSVELELIYLKYEINGQTMLEIDKLNYKYVVNGTDTLAVVREALGLI